MDYEMIGMYTAYAVRMKELTPSEYLVYSVALVETFKKEEPRIHLRNKFLQEKTGLSKPTVTKVLRGLQDKDYLYKIKDKTYEYLVVPKNVTTMGLMVGS